MIGIAAILGGTIVSVVLIISVNDQLADRREKRHKLALKQEKHKSEELQAMFDSESVDTESEDDSGNAKSSSDSKPVVPSPRECAICERTLTRTEARKVHESGLRTTVCSQIRCEDKAREELVREAERTPPATVSESGVINL